MRCAVRPYTWRLAPRAVLDALDASRILPTLSTVGAPHTSTLPFPGSTQPRCCTHSISFRRRGRNETTPVDAAAGAVAVVVFNVVEVAGARLPGAASAAASLEVDGGCTPSLRSRSSSSIERMFLRSASGGRRSTTSDCDNC